MMCNHPLISVLLPVYNVEGYLAQCLDSLLVQSEDDFEIVAINDGSTDGSRGILADYASMDGRIRIIDQQNQGLAAARNTGVDHARGDYIAFVDSDDYVSPDYLSTMLSSLRDYDLDLSICGRQIDDGGVLRPYVRPKFSNRVLTVKESLRALNSYQSFDMSMCGKLFKAELFSGIRFPVSKNSEDQFVCYRILMKAKRTYYQDTPLYTYRHRAGSISRGSTVNTFPIEASHEQLDTFSRELPELVYAAETSCFFSQVSVFNAFALRSRSMPPNVVSCVESEPRTLLPSVLSNPDIPIKKKMQAIAFVFLRPIYKRLYLNQRGNHA
ncbi:glycosyltransferase family 2 protein [Caniella muris]|uniref:glycosyltransferase family 2 protein n=1 Tax=Caniella muris TaxID=2941502 RepID=UPI00203FE44F|nr:glycosyltransferase [Caniella muris]